MMRWLLGTRSVGFDFSVLLLRVVSGLMLLHGIPKLMGFSSMMSDFPDPVGLGSAGSLALCIFAEFFCVVFIVLGAFTRLALIPYVLNMAVAVFVVHGQDPLGKRELGLLYMIIALVLFFTGPGRYSVDALRKA